MKHKKQQGGVWLYLEKSGVLENGTPEQIQAKRDEYWQEYRRTWNKEQRVGFTISCNHKEAEEIVRAADEHHRKPAAFIKEAVFAYLHTSIVLPDPATLNEVRILLSRNYSLLQKIAESNEAIDCDLLMQRMEALEADILNRFKYSTQ